MQSACRFLMKTEVRPDSIIPPRFRAPATICRGMIPAMSRVRKGDVPPPGTRAPKSPVLRPAFDRFQNECSQWRQRKGQRLIHAVKRDGLGGHVLHGRKVAACVTDIVG